MAGQDSADIAATGQDLVTLWIALTATTAESTLEYVKGSHRGPIYDSKYGQHRSLPCVLAPSDAHRIYQIDACLPR